MSAKFGKTPNYEVLFDINNSIKSYRQLEDPTLAKTLMVESPDYGDMPMRFDKMHYQRMFKEQQMAQFEILRNSTSCEYINKEGSNPTFDDATPYGLNKIIELFESEPYNHNLFKWISCTFNNTFIDKSFKENARHGSLEDVNPSKIRNAISQMILLSQAGVYGHVWDTMFKGVEDFIMVKTSKSYFNDDLIHEAFIGLAALNSLRSIIPNFMYVYAVFECNYVDRNVINRGEDDEYTLGYACPDNNDGVAGKYIVVEKINGRRLSDPDLLHILDESAFIEIYTQIIMALHTAYKLYDFTHYDLHDSNVLIEVKEDPVYIPYRFINGTPGPWVFVKTRFVVKIIDYGMSHVKYNDVHYGYKPADFRQVGGTKSDASTPFHDIFKITGFMIYNFFNNSIDDNNNIVDPMLFQMFKAMRPFFIRFPHVRYKINKMKDQKFTEFGHRELDMDDTRKILQYFRNDFFSYRENKNFMESETPHLDVIRLIQNIYNVSDIYYNSDNLPNGVEPYSCTDKNICNNPQEITSLASSLSETLNFDPRYEHIQFKEKPSKRIRM